MYAIDLADVKALGTKLQPQKLPDNLGAEFTQMLEEIKHSAAHAHVPMREADNSPNQLYAEIKVNGETVAKVYNGGIAEMSNRAGSLLVKEFSEQTQVGPELAQMRAERLAEVLGGTVEKAQTAVTQNAWQQKYDAQQLNSPVSNGNLHVDSMSELLEFLQSLKA